MKTSFFLPGILCIIISCLFYIPVYGQANSLPAWVLLEKGKLELFNKEYGAALDLFKTAIREKGNYPEAEILIGDIYTIEGEYAIAKRQYLKAFNNKQYFEVPDDKYPALYKLVEIYKREEEYKNYEDTLWKILNENQEYYKQTYTLFKNKFVDLFKKEGINRLMILYRIADTFAAGAHAELGWFYYKSGRFDSSLIHSLFAINILLSEAVSHYKKLYPEYKFSTVEALLGDILEKTGGIPERNIETASVGESSLKTWLLEEGIFRKLYYLACAAYGAGSREQAFKVWTIIPKNRYSTEWGNLSRKQLLNPWIEDYLDIKAAGMENYKNNQ